MFLSSQKQKNKENRGGHNKETILITIDTFKSLCLKSQTKKANEIHDYYIKMEKILLSTVKEQSANLMRKNKEQYLQLQIKNEIISKKEQEAVLENYM